jgi:phosphatidylcholine synthase
LDPATQVRKNNTALGEAAARDEPRASREKLLVACAWAVHAYTAIGGVVGLLAIEFAAEHRFRASFVAMAVATFIDSSDGPLARALDVRRRVPLFDGTMLDNVVDYITYVIAPAFLMIQAGLLPTGSFGLAIGSMAVFASAYGFCRTDAKTADHYFLGFPSYWNLVAFYLFCFGLPAGFNAVVVIVLAAMVFVPVKYLYPNRTKPLRPLTISLGVIWAIATVALLPQLPAPNPIVLSISFSYIVYYFVVSFVLHYRAATEQIEALN